MKTLVMQKMPFFYSCVLIVLQTIKETSLISKAIKKIIQNVSSFINDEIEEDQKRGT